ncbi:inactive dipeptidyl peptidase 10-like [Nelusetta ayraudi]|uniref:inactive dipeptidyl peptidase 10-like n=1 Tax=Nelusetta ayraudi TaxID=303726 RepID=UPI003F724C82
MTASTEPKKKKKSTSTELPHEEELVDVSHSQRNWKGITISLLVIVVVCSLITMSVVVLTPAEVPGGSRSRLTLYDLHKLVFSVHDPGATWISNSEVVYRNAHGHVVKFNAALNQSELLLSNSTFVAFKAVTFSLSADLQFVLFAYDVRRVYRYSSMASYIVYNLHTREVRELNPPEVDNAVLQHAAWGPRGHQLIYIFENNIYYQPDARGHALRMTSSGREGVVFNGLADWLYEEEVLRSQLAHWWSPGGEQLAFLTIDDSLVPTTLLARLTGEAYPRGAHYPYPVAGEVNPAVHLSVVNLSGAPHTLELQPPEQLQHRDHYITMVTWLSDTHLAVRWVARSQNASVLTVCDITMAACQQTLAEQSDTWLSRQRQVPLFSQDRSRFFLTLPLKQGGQGSFHHLAMCSWKVAPPIGRQPRPPSAPPPQEEVRHLTSGDWEVTAVLAYDDLTHALFFLSTEDSPQQRHLYRVSTLGVFPRQCLTCSLTADCSFLDAALSPDRRLVILRCKGPGVPAVMLLSLDHLDASFILEDNVRLRSALEAKKTPQTEIRTITNGDFELPMKLLYPPDFTDSALYGLLLIVCSSPGCQQVTEEFSLDWDWVLVGSQQVVVARVDGRGSGFRGQRVLTAIYQGLGTVDVDDQLAALEFLTELPFIDRTRVGVFGEDYGGFVTLTMLKQTEQQVRCAATLAPVIDWSLYASVFSERYLGSPSTHSSRYQASRVLADSRSLVSGALLVAHGTADANVHFQHSAELIKHLIRTGANYSLQIFPDEGHFLSGRSHAQLTRSLIGYFGSCLQGASSLLDQRQDSD